MRLYAQDFALMCSLKMLKSVLSCQSSALRRAVTVEDHSEPVPSTRHEEQVLPVPEGFAPLPLGGQAYIVLFSQRDRVFESVTPLVTRSDIQPGVGGNDLLLCVC